MNTPALNSNTPLPPVGFEFKISKKMTLQEGEAMFIFAFCGIFTLLLLVILVLVCKVCALRRAIVPDIRGIEFGEGGRTSSLRLPAFNNE